MSQELFYTSAPRGLRPGSQGFCTVAATRGLSAALVEKLESLSGYRPLFPPHDARAGLNPVAYAHVRVSAGGRTYTVVSRIGPAGLDYTERPNKLAHHVVLDPADLPAGGPAWLLRQPGFLESRWDGQVQVLAAGRIAPRGDVAPDVCRSWQTLTGDAGWGGVLAEAFQADPARLVYLIFEPGMDMLALVAEALALLPPEQRWEVTFSTYFTGLPQGAQCVWRCVPRGSPEAKGARQLPNALLLDVGDELGAARGGALVARARGQAYVPPPLPRKGTEWPDHADGIGEERLPFDKLNPGRRYQPASSAVLNQEGSGTPGPPPPPRQLVADSSRQSGKKPFLFGLGVGAAGALTITLGLLGCLNLSGKGDLLGFHTPNGNEQVHADPARPPVEDATKAERRKELALGASLVGLVGSPPGQGPLLAASVLYPGRRPETVEELVTQRSELKRSTELLSSRLGAAEKQKKELAKQNGNLNDEIKRLKREIKKTNDQRAKAFRSPESDIQELIAQTQEQKDPTQVPDTVREQWAKLDSKLHSWVDQFEAARAPFIPKTIRHYSRLRSALPGDDRIVLPEELRKAGKTEDWTLRLAGLSKDLSQEFKGRRLLIKIQKDNTRVAEFRLEGVDLLFSWEDTSDRTTDARSWVRNSLLEVQAGDKKFFLGLNRLETEPGIPHRFALTQGVQQKFNLNRNKDDIPDRDVYLDFAVCELGGQIRVLQAFPDEKKLQWDSKVVLRLEKLDDARPPKFQIVAHWVGDEKNRTDLILHAFAAYTKVGAHRVEVWRVWGKSR
jgi:hypothetical protein